MLSTTPTPQNRASRGRARGLKTCVRGFCRRPATSAPVFGLQTTKSRRVAKVAATKTASGPSQWLSRDPIGERGGINLYGYVYNNPVKWVDPLGLDVFFNQENETGGHAWTSIGGTSPTGGNTYGEYPNGSLWGNNATVQNPDSHANDDDFSYDRYETTPEDEAALQKWIEDNYDINNENENKNNPKYRLGWEDCRSFNKRAKNQLEKIIKDRKGKVKKTSGQIPKTPGSP